MIDVSDYEKIDDENRGVNEKLWINVEGRPALFKRTQIRDNGTHTNAHYGEAFVSQMCRLLDYKCAEVEIAQRNGEIGCISYSFLKEDDELVDFVSLLQNIRPSFDSKKMLVPETNETYSIPLILEALEEETSSEEEFKNLKRDFLKSCIIDSLIEHYDRNPSNISVIRNNGHITLSPMFDNGTSLNLSIPADVIKEHENDEKWSKLLREKNRSKIGVEGEKYSSYDKLLDYILSNCYEDVADFISVIQEKLTKENIARILEHDDYADMDNVFKELIIKKITDNVRDLAEKSKEYENKYTVEQYMKTPNTYEYLKEKVKTRDLQIIIPEINACIDCPQRNPYHIYSVSDYMFRCIEQINNIEEIARENGIELKISDKNKSLIQWAVLFNELGKPHAREEIGDADGNIRDTFRNYSEYGEEIAKNLMERLNFYETDKKIVTALISSHQRRSLETDNPIKKLINEIGERNIDLYFGMKLAEIKSKNPEIEKEALLKLKILKERIDKTIADDNREIIKVLPFNGEQMKKLGLQGRQIGEIFNLLARFVKSNPDIYAYYKSRGHLQKYKKNIARLSQEYAKEIKNREKRKQKEAKMEKVELIPTNETSEYYREHVAGRHGKGSTAIGSKLLDDVSDDYILEVLSKTDNAYQEAIDEKGKPGRMVFAVQADRPIGTNALLPKENLDNNSVFSTTRDIGTRGEAQVLVALISKDEMPKTNIAHVIMGHYGPTGKAGIYTMICGDEGMPMPRAVDENTPPEAVRFNEECQKYWDSHVFLITPEELKANIAQLQANGISATKQELFLRAFEAKGEKSPIAKPYQAYVSPNAVKLQVKSSKNFVAAKDGRE